eukprot:CAMPEP_0118901158 /NCGR_PEP_ID=MMETSP1166-20130328/6975_1 /TAXON_ID=1104430 /ORGANISM="Chrysoreinhardia sp, Strain CCMP3193" /LENGTH=745 /DNA_ID=CAMNT_0006840323 /DNA_START=96 /DNA_END=2333 /DNA_ORIENTATION=-
MAFLLLLVASSASAGCPYLATTTTTTEEALSKPSLSLSSTPSSLSTLEQKQAQHAAYVDATRNTDWDAVRQDIDEFLTTSQDDAWPADFGNYGPLFVRLAWHNAGSYRTSDGRGGVDGARQRFDPERSWDDNTNLDKARALLFSVKKKHPEVSWGDLIVLTGTQAIQTMGGPVLGFCSGRVDDPDGSDSLLLGPSSEQEAYAPCAFNGSCAEPLGSTTIGLIYLNPQGPFGLPDSYLASKDVRDSFNRMSMNNSETVALIGGGHTFGKAHGACPKGAGPPPKVDEVNPWPGLCGSGKSVDTFTSGIEGAWTTKPTTWDNEYFENLLTYDWRSHSGPGGAWQWRVNPGGNDGPPLPSPLAPTVDGTGTPQATMMMTSDVALTTDDLYRSIVREFADSLPAFETAFAAAWYKLVTRDMGPVFRCGNRGKQQNSQAPPPPQDFQHYLEPVEAVNYEEADVVDALTSQVFTSALRGGEGESAVSAVVKLAYACASTFRYTDYLGGCNGARIRFEPAKSWKANGYGEVVTRGLAVLSPVKDQFDISWADLVVLAGGVALEVASKGQVAIPFCPGRSDDISGDALKWLEPPVVGDVGETVDELKEFIQRTGVSYRDYVALLGARRSLGPATTPFYGDYTSDTATLDNGYFQDLLANTYIQVIALNDGDAVQYKAEDADLYAQSIDIMLKSDPELLALAQTYAADNDTFLADLATAWTKLMNADRFDRPACLLTSTPLVTSKATAATEEIAK